jgi:hypothetical protein
MRWGTGLSTLQEHRCGTPLGNRAELARGPAEASRAAASAAAVAGQGVWLAGAAGRDEFDCTPARSAPTASRSKRTPGACTGAIAWPASVQVPCLRPRRLHDLSQHFAHVPRRRREGGTPAGTQSGVLGACRRRRPLQTKRPPSKWSPPDGRDSAKRRWVSADKGSLAYADDHMPL